jgi:conjugal transfer pilus assembly protein TraL
MIFLWEFDVAIMFMSILGLGILMGAFFTPLTIAIGAAIAYQKLKSGRHKGYSVHLMYWFLPIGIGTKRTPPSYARHFVG